MFVPGGGGGVAGIDAAMLDIAPGDGCGTATGGEIDTGGATDIPPASLIIGPGVGGISFSAPLPAMIEFGSTLAVRTSGIAPGIAIAGGAYSMLIRALLSSGDIVGSATML